MEGDAVSATIQVLVQNLIDLSKQEISLIRGLEGEAEKLRGTFGIIQSYLDDAETKSINDAAVRTWLKELKEKSFDADNALDELNYQLLSNKRKEKVQRRDLALRIKEINTSFESINGRAKELGLEGKLAAAPAAASDAASETNSFTVDSIFIGRDYDVSKIVEMLTNLTEEAVSILPIVGMGGMGKTTLAWNVFNHQKTKTHFGQHIWVHVSQTFDAGVLFKKILTNLKSEEVADESSEVVLKKLQEALKGKTYVLVLDDVWNENQLKWGDFIRSWSGITSTRGNGIIVTTRKEGVGSLVKTGDMHLLNGLSKEECWSIIKDRAFERGSIITPDLEDIGTSIAERCQGLPLAANVVGGVLRGKLRDEWLSIKQNWLSDDGGDQNYISKILKLSFHHLSTPSLKKCFAYCSIFPKGYSIDRVKLIELWMAEGLLQPDQTRDMETIGNKNFNDLLHNSLLQVVYRDGNGEVKLCSMHDLVHDVADSISDVAYFKNIEESCRIPTAEAKWLRTLIYNGRISDIVFSDFKSLHSLTLTDYKVEELSDSIKVLIHLRYLNISATQIKYLPNSIGELSHLQTIWSFILKELPSTLKHLFNLRHLHMGDNIVLPPYMGMLTSLQTLPCFKVRNKDGHRIVELGSLENLKGKLEIRNLEKVEGEEESKKACLFQRSGIVRLVLMWGENSLAWGWRNRARGDWINDENVLKGLQPHSNLKGLEIIGFGGSSFPSWTLKMAVYLEGRWEALNNLMEIRLEDCFECEEIPALGQLPHLKSLILISLDKVKSLGASFYGNSNNGVYKETISVFPALERLVLRRMENLTEWKGVEIPSGAQVEVFPCLEYLTIFNCRKLRSAPGQFTSLKELGIYSMDSGLPLASICGSKLKTLTKLIISSVKELICLPDWLFHNNQHLSRLYIEYCPKLRELPNGMHSLNSLEKLTLEGCNNLKSISGGGKLQGLTSLRELSIIGCQVLTNVICEMGDSPLLEYLCVGPGYSDAWDCVSSFNKVVDGILRLRSHSRLTLELRGREDWESLPDQLQHLTALTRLKLFKFGIEELPEWFGNLSSLQELELSFCEKLKHLPSVESMRRLTKLTSLDIYGCLLLRERGIETQSDDVDSEWPKISHLPNIYVNGKYIGREAVELQKRSDVATLVEKSGSEIRREVKFLGSAEIRREAASNVHEALIPSSDSVSVSKDQSEQQPAAEEESAILKDSKAKMPRNMPTSVSALESMQTVESEFFGEIRREVKFLGSAEIRREAASNVHEALIPSSDSVSVSKDQSEQQPAAEEESAILKDSKAKMPRNMPTSVSALESMQTVESEFFGEIQLAISGEENLYSAQRDIVSTLKKERSMHHEEPRSIATEFVQEEKHYLVTVKEDHIKLELDHQIILIEDIRSPTQPESTPVKPVLNLAEQNLRELPEKSDYLDSFVLFLQRNYQLTLIHSSFFDSMPNLRFLDLSDTRIRILPSSLYMLLKLKVLILSNCAGLENLPSDIGNLSQVEVLDLSGTTELYSLPDETGQLVLLRHMKLSFYGPDDESEFEHLPSQLVSPNILSELKELRAFSITVHPGDHRWTDIASRVLQEVSKLEMLSYLQFYFPKVEIFEEYIQTNKHALTKFSFTVGHNVKRIVSRVPDEVESLFDQQDKCLRFVNGDKVSQLIKTALIQVTAFYLDHHTEIQRLSEFDISNFKALKFCVVRECPNIQAIMDGKTAEGQFPCLEYLGVFYLWELKHIWKPPSPPGRLKRILTTPAHFGHFKSLKCLVVITCPKLQFILWESMLQCLSNLEELVVKDCEKVQKIIKEEKKKAKYDDVILPRLGKLELHYLPDLVSLGNGLRLSEEKVNVHGCPKLIL